MKSRVLSILLAVCMVIAMLPHHVEAADETTGYDVISIDMSSGFYYFLDGDTKEITALRNVFPKLMEAGVFGGEGDSYDIDKDGTIDLTVENEHKTEDKPYSLEMIWFLVSETTSIEGQKVTVTVPDEIIAELQKNGDYYVKTIELVFPVIIREINLKITAPADGSVTETPKKEEFWDYEAQTNAPSLELVGDDDWLDLAIAYWLDESGSEPYQGTLEGGRTYHVGIELMPKPGYMVVEDAPITVEGMDITASEILSFTAAIEGTLTVSHTLTLQEGQAATCEADGYEPYYVCDGCGGMYADAEGTEEISEPKPITATGHDWGEWQVTKAPTETEEGEETRVCIHDPSHVETRPVPVIEPEQEESEAEESSAEESVAEESTANSESTDQSSGINDDIPKTGDNNDLTLPIILMCASVAGIAVIAVILKKNKDSKD